jgi:transcription elongation factor Elf1/ATP-dependent Clp protease adapter protein ClpS
MPKASKKEMLRLYKDHQVQLLISKFVSGELGTLTPTFDLKQGFMYPVADEIVGDSHRTEKFLQKLFEGSVLERKLYDKIIYCPSCNSANVSTHYTCPHCKSFDVKKSALIEHIKCGYIDTEDHFQKDGKLVCPRCNKELINPDLDYHRAGVWCTCNQCAKSFDIPVPAHFCRECKENFSFDDAICKDVYSYSLTPEAAKEANLSCVLTVPIIEFLEDLGFEVESPGFLNGKSGTRHMFDLTAVSSGKKKKTTVIDLATSTDDVVSEQSVISMFAKIFDANPEKACLVAVPKMSENGRKLATLYKIDLIEAKNQTAAVEALKNCVKK